jgi:hypothetical protein
MITCGRIPATAGPDRVAEVSRAHVAQLWATDFSANERRGKGGRPFLDSEGVREGVAAATRSIPILIRN